jgi:hypothetical protein
VDDREKGKKASDPWRGCLAQNLDGVVGSEMRRKIVNDNDLKGEHTCQENVEWTAQTMRRLDQELEEGDRIEVLNRCAHVMPEERIAPRRELFDRTHDLIALHRYCQEDFVASLDLWYGPLPQQWMDIIIGNGWGEAGRLEGRRIIATKMPSDLRAYFQADDERGRRRAYCHCHRIQGAFEEGAPSISPTYCNCGAGFYRYNWERMIGRPVQVRVLRSLLKGDDVCQFEIVLPQDL